MFTTVSCLGVLLDMSDSFVDQYDLMKYADSTNKKMSHALIAISLFSIK